MYDVEQLGADRDSNNTSPKAEAGGQRSKAIVESRIGVAGRVDHGDDWRDGEGRLRGRVFECCVPICKDAIDGCRKRR